ncbi:MAG: PAS domain S-box protein, partial [Dehalococcoidia bacterium]
MAAPADDGIARIVKRLALMFALSVALGLPGGYFGLQYSNHIKHVELTARLKAGSLSALVAANPELWIYELQRVEELLVRYPPQLADDRATVRDTAGNLLVALGVRPHAPVLVSSSPIYDSGRVVGQVRITHSYREVVFGTLAAGLLGLLLGILVYATLLALPLRALWRVTAALVRETAALSASASRYRALAESTTDAIITADGAGTIVGWNPAAGRMFGYTETEAVGQPLTLVIPHRYRAGHLAGIQRMQAGGERRLIGKSVELHGLTKAGHEFPLEIALSEWETPEGRFFAGIIHDITERKRVALALARQTDLYHMLSQANQAIVRITSREELFPAMCRIAVEHGRFRFAWIGLIDKGDSRLKPVARYGEDSGYVDALDVLGDAAGDTRRGFAGRTLLSGTHVISNDILNDPAMAPWHEAARRAGVRASAKFPIRQDSAVIGAINLYAGDPGFFTEELIATLDEIAIDVSFALDNFAREAARRKAEEALREGEERYRRMFRANPHPMWVYDVETLAFLAVNDAAMEHYGWSREEFLAMTITDLRPVEDKPALLEYLSAESGKKLRKNDSVKLRKKDGTLIDVEITSHVIDFGGRPARIVSAHDITERKQAEQVLREGEAQFRSLVEQSIAGIYIIQDG